jgi:nickel-type superoxide dismutase maturation protease
MYRVAGDSMQPTYQPGDTLLGTGWFTPAIGQVVVADHAGRPVIKRITRLSRTHVWLAGDNPAASTDSRQYGPIVRTALQSNILIKF